MRMPAFCRNCGTPFGSGVEVQNARNITVRKITAGPCPKCGGTGEVVDGTFDVIGDTLTMLKGPAISRERLWRLRDILESQRAAGVPAEEVERRIYEEIPEAEGWVAEFRSMGPIARLMLLLTLITLILDHPQVVEDMAGAVQWAARQVTDGTW